MKKIIIIVLIILLSVLLFVSCSKTNNNSNINVNSGTLTIENSDIKVLNGIKINVKMKAVKRAAPVLNVR